MFFFVDCGGRAYWWDCAEGQISHNYLANSLTNPPSKEEEEEEEEDNDNNDEEEEEEELRGRSCIIF